VRLLLVLVVAACASARPPALQQLPADGKLFDGDTAFIAAERYRGRVVVLDFWAGWCQECKRTVPQVVRLADAFAKEGLVVVGVNAGERGADVTAYARDLGIDYPIALDPELVFSDRLGAANLPVLLVIDRNGAVVHRSRHVDSETLAVIRRLLHEH
jgi:cytochrome c biogenesis protein CcmG, thiol:disulfide interchange protein DsbE